jgi:hypothetical protein
MSYLYFNELNTDGRKTRIWEVTATATDEVLGRISFWGAWRKYIFSPLAGTFFDASCLEEISSFTAQVTKEWRESVAVRTKYAEKGGATCPSTKTTDRQNVRA